MLKQIQKCQKCGLYLNQKPLLDTEKECQVFWVGLSAKKVLSDTEGPLSPETNTGALIKQIEDGCEEISTYKTNLVKCLPLTEQHKLRYPNQKEISCCITHLISEINAMSPKIVFLLGEKVYFAVGKYFGIKFEKWDEFNFSHIKIGDTYYVPIQHPSYICIYKRKQINEYVNSVRKIIEYLLTQ